MDLLEILRKNKTRFLYCDIYALGCVNNGKQAMYIGSSVEVYSRLRSHIGDLREGKHFNVYLQRLWNKLGEDAFYLVKLEECKRSKRFEIEQIYIDCNENCNLAKKVNEIPQTVSGLKGKTYLEIHGTVRPKCGFKPGNKPTREVQAIISASTKQMWESGKLKGFKKSPEIRAKQAASQKLNWALHKEERRAKVLATKEKNGAAAQSKTNS